MSGRGATVCRPENNISLLELLELLELLGLLGLLEFVLGQEVPYRRAGWRPEDQKLAVRGIGRIRRELDWTPRVSSEEGVKRLVDRVQANGAWCYLRD